MSSEATIQNALHSWRTERDHPFIAPNVTMPSGEMDLISISKAGFVYEHEIKISRADFKADFKHKEEKHVWMRDAKKLKGECVRWIENNRQWGTFVLQHCANYFIYVCPADLVKAEEVPAYAGLCYWTPSKYWKYGEILVIKEPPRLHREKVTQERMEKLARSMMYRYWNYRLNK